MSKVILIEINNGTHTYLKYRNFWCTGTLVPLVDLNKGCYVTSKQGVGGEWEIKFSESDICERLAPAQSATRHMLSAGQSGPGTHVIIEKHGSLWLSTLTLYSK